VVILLCNVDPLVFNALVKLLKLVAADWLLVVTVVCRVVMLLCKVDPLVLSALVRLFREVAAD
jgi:hypothetical protein